ncbi:hypothetical protein [Bradyrhizobium liaoningense]|uniref:hypothetical protein n=1 Tax=Bradyrhizobium liaoningense TaxID=43992 RepID=UPI001BAAED38|nr:hypothetical protein [Bradyrhizobium liaoningense]MBR1034591.1 hypothetical protein [Bradyrhizobium liaoningense]
MPYYVYAIHTDHTNNRLYKVLDEVVAAEKLEREMSDHCFARDNYFVRSFFAKDSMEAEAKADALRPYPKLKPSS